MPRPVEEPFSLEVLLEEQAGRCRRERGEPSHAVTMPGRRLLTRIVRRPGAPNCGVVNGVNADEVSVKIELPSGELRRTRLPRVHRLPQRAGRMASA
eukprot:COSAG03_NODE_1251_length_4472_cov_70.829636_5_plen_97_part_00